MDMKLDFEIDLLKFKTKTLANISAFYLTFFVGKLVSCQSMEASNFRMSLMTSSFYIFEKVIFDFHSRFLLWQLSWSGPYILHYILKQGH